MDVLSIHSGEAVWMCPECGHGSPDPRDEQAHLDAHQQLRAFFEEWEAGTGTGGLRRPAARRVTAAVAAVIGALVICLSVVVFSRVHARDDPSGRGTPTGSVPGVVGPEVRSGPPPALTARPPQPVPGAGGAATPPPAPSAVPEVQRAATPPPASSVAPGAVMAPVSATPVFVPPPPPPVNLGPTERGAFLVQFCLLGICITI